MHHLLPTPPATERMDQLYMSTLAALSAGHTDPAAGALALAADPGAYQQQLAEAVTGVPVLREGYDTAYDMLLQVWLYGAGGLGGWTGGRCQPTCSGCGAGGAYGAGVLLCDRRWRRRWR